MINMGDKGLSAKAEGPAAPNETEAQEEPMKARCILCLLLALAMAAAPALSRAEYELHLKRYSLVHLEERKLVYQGPGKDYFRDGSAGVGATNDVRVYGTSEGWMLVGYLYSTDNFRVGWVEIPKHDITWLKEADVGELSFERTARRVADDCAITYDPVFVSTRALDLSKGEIVTLLCVLPEKWAYVEVKTKGKLTRGFMYADMLDLSPIAADAPELSEGGGSPKTVLKEQVTKTPGGNYAVFSGPGEGYARAEGEPYIGFAAKAKVYGTEGKWALVSFTGNDKKTHYGYLPVSLLPDVSKVKEMTTDRAACRAARDTALRDAPDSSAAAALTAPEGAALIFLSWADKKKTWAYVEYRTQTEKARGFVPAADAVFE